MRVPARPHEAGAGERTLRSAAHEEPREEVDGMAKGRILVVDDEIYIVHILDFSLGMEGYEVLTALDGEQAVEKARAEKPDLVVLDIMMPKLDGYETCKLLKADPLTKDIPVILLSAKGRNVDQKIGFEVGADDYITKPFSPRKLVERINAILGQSSSQQRSA
jgi:two-component system alkaline phosphatase synthesis response regulator PhoP